MPRKLKQFAQPNLMEGLIALTSLRRLLGRGAGFGLPGCGAQEVATAISVLRNAPSLATAYRVAQVFMLRSLQGFFGSGGLSADNRVCSLLVSVASRRAPDMGSELCAESTHYPDWIN